MYTIFNVIYGIPLTGEIMNVIRGDDVEVDDCPCTDTDYDESCQYHGTGLGSGDAAACGFEVTYSGSGDYMPGWCGVNMYEFDECDVTLVRDMKLVPTEEQIAEARMKCEMLD